MLLAHVTGVARSWLMAHGEAGLSAGQRLALTSLLQRLEAGEPLPYVLGHWEFFGLDFEVTPDVLIPRPETELLVELALGWLKADPGRISQKWSVLDIGTGSGCIAVSLAANLPGLCLLAADISLPALRVAGRNTRKNAVADRVGLIQCDLFPPSAIPIHLVCANLPYVPTSLLETLPVSRWEPRLALDGGPDGLGPFRRLFEQEARHLAPNACMLLEIEATMGERVAALAQQTLPPGEVRLRQDLAGRDRLVEVNLF